MPKLSEFYADKINALVGGMITETFIEKDPFEFGGECFWGFQVRTREGKLFDVWVNRDGEGNGPGAVSVEPSPAK